MRTCVIDIPGLSGRLIDRLPADRTPAWWAEVAAHGRCAIRPVLPAVTMTAQATYTTGVLPQEHGIICNGLPGVRVPALRDHFDLDSYVEYRRNVSFWEQSNKLLTSPRLWHKQGHKAAMLFVQSSMDGAADVVVTPKPSHTPDGRTVPDCWSTPSDLYSRLKAQLGEFPLMHYWGPLAGLKSTEWIAAAARLVWEWEPTDLQMVYIPQMDYDLQRLGPDDPKCTEILVQVLSLLTPLAEKVRADGGRVLVLSEYGMTPVNRSAAPNLLFRREGLLVTDPRNEIDYEKSAAFAMVDHQVAHVYCRDAATIDKAEKLLQNLPGVHRIYREKQRVEVGLDSERAGDLVVFSHADAWFEYRWFDDFTTAPPYVWTVDIHRKPGYDPTEMFLDFATRKTRADQPHLVKGSHGALPENENDWPILLGAAGAAGKIDATQVAGLL